MKIKEFINIIKDLEDTDAEIVINGSTNFIINKLYSNNKIKLIIDTHRSSSNSVTNTPCDTEILWRNKIC